MNILKPDSPTTITDCTSAPNRGTTVFLHENRRSSIFMYTVGTCLLYSKSINSRCNHTHHGGYRWTNTLAQMCENMYWELGVSGGVGAPQLGIDYWVNIDTTTNTYTITGSPVPIPGSLLLLGTGLIGLVGIARKKRSSWLNVDCCIIVLYRIKRGEKYEKVI